MFKQHYTYFHTLFHQFQKIQTTLLEISYPHLLNSYRKTHKIGNSHLLNNNVKIAKTIKPNQKKKRKELRKKDRKRERNQNLKERETSFYDGGGERELLGRWRGVLLLLIYGGVTHSTSTRQEQSKAKRGAEGLQCKRRKN